MVAKDVKKIADDITNGALQSMTSVKYNGNDVTVTNIGADNYEEISAQKNQTIKAVLNELKGQEVPPAAQQIFDKATSLKQDSGIVQTLGNATKPKVDSVAVPAT